MAATTTRPRLVLAGIVLSALALRPQIIAIGPLVDAIDSDLGVSHTVTGLLGTIPLLCMGLFAPAAGPLAARVGATRAMTLVLLTIGIAGIARAVAPGAAGVIALTVPIGIGIAIGNVLAPVIVKTAFADRPLLATGLFAFGIQIGAGVERRSGRAARGRAGRMAGQPARDLAGVRRCGRGVDPGGARRPHAGGHAAGADAALALPVRLAPGDHVRLRLHHLLRHGRLARRRVRRARLERGAGGLADRHPQHHGARAGRC